MEAQIFLMGGNPPIKNHTIVNKLCHQGRSKELSFLQFIEKIGNRI